jgi:hypothetical protein
MGKKQADSAPDFCVCCARPFACVCLSRCNLSCPHSLNFSCVCQTAPVIASRDILLSSCTACPKPTRMWHFIQHPPRTDACRFGGDESGSSQTWSLWRDHCYIKENLNLPAHDPNWKNRQPAKAPSITTESHYPLHCEAITKLAILNSTQTTNISICHIYLHREIILEKFEPIRRNPRTQNCRMDDHENRMTSNHNTSHRNALQLSYNDVREQCLLT